MHDKVKECKTYIGTVFEKNFHYELDPENKDTFTLLEKREHLKKMYAASESMPQSFRSQLLLELLENGMKLDINDEAYMKESMDYFLLYVDNPLKIHFMK